ncbi:MAG: AAA family ATPase [Lachnospiraceae bacterium]|nr:AAA family ATPase [Lachnospiraceae bacterium]
MKFESIVMYNFMRYKGKNRIDFCCDEKKNVTIVLGDNTVGKTTIAQAFRWGLYGKLMASTAKGKSDYQLLNNDILEMMDANSYASVKVEIAAVNNEKRYIITREIVYTRAFPKMEAREFQKKLSMRMTDIDFMESYVTVEEQEIENLINELFPMNLSHYFLFDGERWNDVSVGGVKENIKESVHILTGLSAYKSAMWHLKSMGSNSVIKKFRSKISGSGAVYDNLVAEQKKIERTIESLKENNKTLDINIKNYEQRQQEMDRFLEQNKSTEELQTKQKHLAALSHSQKDRSLTNYKMLVNAFSEKAFMLFSEPLIRASIKILREAKVERRDIPYMRQATIDYIIKNGTCICGNPIREGTDGYFCLMEQRKYLYPADIGSLLGDFERSAKRWEQKSRGIREEIRENAERADESIREYNDTYNRYAVLQRKLDEHIDFAEKRKKQQYYQREIQRFSKEKGENEGRIESYRKRYASIEKEMQSLEAKDAENKRWRGRLELAEELYQKLEKEFSTQEKKIFLELNREIQNNFSRMFNAKDKKIELTNNYEIQMLYQTKQGYREEQNLSEGEKIARNFAFIVTIMDFSRRKKAEQTGSYSEENDTLPIVLDGPFSKLGDENIELIAKILPEVSEQVIIFMLKKDWAYTKLDKYVGCAYRIEKRAEESFASIKREEMNCDHG